MATETYDESVHRAVARETARRKRVFLGFLGLLLLPIAIGIYALIKAPSEADKIADDVAPKVQRQIGGNIAASVTADVESRTRPVVERLVSNEIARIEPRILANAADTIARIEGRMRSGLDASRAEVATLRQILGGQIREVSEQTDNLGTRLTKDINASNARLDRFDERITDAYKQASSGSAKATAAERTVAVLQERIAQLEGQLKEYQTRVGKLERTLNQRAPR